MTITELFSPYDKLSSNLSVLLILGLTSIQPFYHMIHRDAQRTPDFKRLSAIFINNGDWYIAEYDGDDIF